MSRPYHLQDKTTRHTIRSKDKTVSLYLDQNNYQLSIRPRNAKKPYIVDSVTLLALANLLHIEYEHIVEEAREHIVLQGEGKRSHVISGYSGF